MRVSLVVPVLDEEQALGQTLRRAVAGLAHGDEIVVADGGSRDRTVEIARTSGARVVNAERGRGRQMNAGAAVATGDVLLFLHADTLLPHGYHDAIDAVFENPEVRWGRFDLRFDEGGALLGLIAHLINARSRVFRSATGDQAIFVRRAEFEAVGGYREPILFEDVDLVRTLRARGGMGIPAGKVVTSARRWRKRGVLATTLRMWTLKSLYLCGVAADTLAKRYRDTR